LILSVGQVVPHEVVGMANHAKNIFVGCGGNRMINASHILGAFYGMERMMGKDHTPVRKVFDYAQEHFLKDVPLQYVLTVTTAPNNQPRIHGLFIGGGRRGFEKAVELAQQKNLIFVDKPFKKVVVNMDPSEFKTTWLANKSVYRTRMAIADGGELIVLAPGVHKFGEDDQIDRLIRKYGYTGREHIIDLCKTQEDLKGNMSAAAHLIHGSSDGRFKVTYCTRLLSEEEVRGAGYDYMPYDEMVKTYDPAVLTDGWHTIGGEEIFYISNPALGLWADKGKF
ncbi:MAG: D-mannonate epimerase, partial [Alistipes sp.]|nr:D-mannonate epimerase [Alistipes sp.]